MNLRANVNKIHADMISVFEDVQISEKSSKDRGEYLEFVTVNEKKELVILVSKKELSSDNFNWSYYSNPLKKTHLVERKSNVNDMIKDIQDIFEKNRFDSEYIKSIN
jgi:hypothetical protein